MSEKRKFLYFYSARCKFCSQFSEMLAKSNDSVKNNFINISIDDASIRLPPYLEVVPTIQIYDDGGRRHVLSDKHAFEWLNQYTQKPVETEPFCIGEMGSNLSDCFSFLDGKDDNISTSDKAYASLSQLDEFYITTPNEGVAQKTGGNGGSGGGGARSLENLDKLTSDMQKLQQQRNKETPQRGGSAPKVPDFTQPNGGSMVGRTNEFGTISVGQEKDQQSQKFQRQYDLVVQQRNADVPRRKIPTSAPNFESPNYKSQFVTNDMMKQANRNRPQGSHKMDYKNIAPSVPKPTENPDFGVSSYFDNQNRRQQNPNQPQRQPQRQQVNPRQQPPRQQLNPRQQPPRQQLNPRQNPQRQQINPRQIPQRQRQLPYKRI